MRHRIGDFAQCWQGFDRIVALPEPTPQSGVGFRRALEGLSPGLGSAPEAARGVPCVCSGAARSEASQKGIAAAVRIRLKNQSFAERRFPTGKVRVSGHRTGCHDSGQRPCGNGRKPASEARTDTGFHVALCSFVGIDPCWGNPPFSWRFPRGASRLAASRSARFSRPSADNALTRRRPPRTGPFPPEATKRLPRRAFRVPLRPAPAAAAALTGSQLWGDSGSRGIFANPMSHFVPLLG